MQMMNRRIALLVLLFASVCLPQQAPAMIFRPQQGAMWDPSIIWHDGKYHAFMMYNKDGNDGLGAGQIGRAHV
jgi:sucrose-6-phosphate hydrolase SacC (GH32 family)